MMEAYLVRITEPMQIPAISIETKERGKKDEVYALLHHTERPNIVRSSMETLSSLDGITVTRRPDAGGSWYHSSGSRCLTIAMPAPRPVIAQLEFGIRLIGLLNEFDPAQNYTCDRKDIFLDDGRQIVGMSGDTKEGSMLRRACWYESDPKLEITSLLTADGVDPEEFLRGLAIMQRGFFDYLAHELNAQEIHPNDYISQVSMRQAMELQNKECRYKPKTCVGNLETGRSKVSL
jgi:hypothetical protein